VRGYIRYRCSHTHPDAARLLPKTCTYLFLFPAPPTGSSSCTTMTGPPLTRLLPSASFANPFSPSVSSNEKRSL
jgi:hypothetical protein